MESYWLFVVTSFLLNGSLRGQETNVTSGCLWDNMYSYSCTSTGITDLQEVGRGSKKIPSWPRSPRLLKNMKNINLSNNMISSLHFNIFYKFLYLETLNVSNNFISLVSINYEQEGKDAILGSLHTLVLDRNRLIFVPKGLGKLTSLQRIHLSANSIVQIQRDDFANCTQLQHLDLGDNRIHKIDMDAFRDLRNLQVLRLNNNELVSISPLVFLYGQVLRADIDLSYNRWACDCRILPLKELLTSLPADMKKEWNITCSTPHSRTGSHLLSIDHINGACKSPVDKYIYTRRIVVKKGENTYLPCNIPDKMGHKKAFWWTPQGIISREPSVTNPYIDTMNNFILTEPDRSHEGLYICIADLKRIVYHVHYQTDEEKTLVRRSRDTQLLNARIHTDYDFARAVVLSVVISFICAFLLGVFLRPYLERLWRKLCKPKDSNKKTTTEVYENEGFSEETVPRRHSSNGQGNSVPVNLSKDNTSSETDFEEPDGSKYKNTTYNEREIYYRDEPGSLDMQTPTHVEPLGRSDTYIVVEGESKNVHAAGKSNSKNSKRVTWAGNEESSPKVNLKHVMSLLKPINIIVPDTPMENTDQHERKPEHGYSDTHIPKKNRGSFSDIASSDESEFWDAEDLLSDEDTIVSRVSQQVGSTSNGNVIPTSSKNLFKDINQYIDESSLSDDGSSSSGENPSSKEDSTINTRVTKENDSPKVNIKHVMSLVKPISIVAPEYTACDIVKSPTQKQLFPFVLPRYPEHRMEYAQDIRLSENKPTKDTIGNKKFYDSSSSDDETKDNSKSFITPNTYTEVTQTRYDSSSSEDGLADGRSITNSILLTAKPETWKTKESDSTTVNLKHLMTLLKPINITIPESTVTDLVKTPSQIRFIPTSIPRYPEHRAGDVEHNLYNKTPEEDDSSDDGSEFDYDDSSDEEVKMYPGSLLTKETSQTSSVDTRPTVNLQQVIALLKPINIIAPKFENIMDKYDESLVSSSRPTNDMGSKQTSFDSNSSDNESKEIDEDKSADEESIIPSVLVTQEIWLKQQKGSPTVNLKHVMSLIKPIKIISPESTKIDLGKSPSQKTTIFPGSISKFPEQRTEDVEDLYYDQDMKLTGEPENKPNSKDQISDRSHTLPISHGEGKKTFSDSSSSDNESKTDKDEGSIIPSVLLTKQASWATQQKVSPTVNLKHVMSLVKPINITFPESTKIDIVKSPSQTQFSPSSMSRYPEPKIEVIEYLHYDQDMKLSGDPENKLNNRDQISDKIHTLPISDGEGKKRFYDSSSSDDTIEASSDEEVKINLGFSLTPQASLTNSVDTRPTVNLHRIISLLKPISIIAPSSDNRIEERKNLLNQFKEPGNQSPYPKYEVSYASSTRPRNDMEGEQTSSDSSSSDDESKKDKDDHISDGGSIIPSVLLTKQASLAAQQNVSPTVNLKHVMSLVKPINITFPESTKIDIVKSPSQTQFSPSSMSRYPEPKIEVIEYLHYDQDMKLDPKHKQNNRYQIYDKSPTLSINDGEGENTFYDSSSSDDTLQASSDDGVTQNPGLLLSMQPSLTRKENENPKVNLQQVISLLKPINIIVPNNSITESVRSPSEEHLFPTDSINYEDPISSTILTNDSKGKQTYDSSSSEEESKNDEDHRSDEESIQNSDLFITQQATWTRKENISPTMSLKHAVSLVRPISITIPDDTTSEKLQSPSQKYQVFPSIIPRKPENKIEDIQPSRGLEHQSQVPKSETQADLKIYYPHFQQHIEKYEGVENQSQDTSYEKYNSEILSKPTKLERYKEIRYDSRSSDNSSDNNAYEGGEMNADSLTQFNSTWTSTKNVSPKMNITDPDSTVNEALRRFQEKYNVQVDGHQTVNQLQNITLKDPLTDKLNTPETIRDDNSEVPDAFYNWSSENESSHISNKGGIKNSAYLTPNQATLASNDNSSPKLNLKHVMSLLKPINITVPDSTLTDTVESPTKVLLGDRPSHNTVSEYYTDNINGSSSDDGSFFSFSQSNSLSDDSEKIDIARDEMDGLMAIHSSNRSNNSLPRAANSNVSPGRRKRGKKSTVHSSPHMAQKEEALKDCAGGGHELNKANDVLHWLNTNTNDETNNEFPISKDFPTETSEQEPVFDLNTQEWTSRIIVRKETVTMSRYKSQMFDDKSYLIPEFGETSTDTDLLDFNSHNSEPQVDVKIEKVVSTTVDHSTPKQHGSFFTNRRKVFDAFCDSLKEE